MTKETKTYADIAEEAKAKKDKRKKAPKVFEMREAFFADEVSDGLLYSENEKTFYKYDNGVYLLLSHENLQIIIDDFLLRKYQGRIDATTPIINEVIKAITRTTNPDQLMKISGKEIYPRSAFTDKTFNFKTFELEEHDPEKPCFHRFPFPFPEKAKQTPAFDKFIEETFVRADGSPDKDLQNFMLDILAYYMTSIHGSSAIGVILQGSGSNGKSTYLDLLKTIVGEEFCTHLSLEDLSEKFGAAELIGAKVNIVHEDQSRYIRPDKIKALITMDKIKAERKFEQPFFFTPSAKHIISTNKQVKFEDIDYAILRRVCVVPFFMTFVPPGGADPMAPKPDGKLVREIDYTLEPAMMGDELPFIVLKLIRRLEEMKKTNYAIHIPLSLLDTRRELQTSSSTALEFFHEYFEYDPDYDEPISTQQIYDMYKEWYRDSAKPERFLMQSRHFWDTLNKNFPSITSDKKVYYKSNRTAAKVHMKPTRFDARDEFGNVRSIYDSEGN